MVTFSFSAGGGPFALPLVLAVVAFVFAAFPRAGWMTHRQKARIRRERIGCMIGGVLCAAAAFLWPSGNAFSRLTVYQDEIYLDYDRSGRRDTIPMAEIDALQWISHMVEPRYRPQDPYEVFYLRIWTHRGDSYVSGSLSAEEAAVMKPRLAERVTITPSPIRSRIFLPGRDTAGR